MLSSVNSDFDRICAAVLHKYDRLILHIIIPTKGGESCRDFSAFKGSCKLNNCLPLLSSFLSFIFALNFLHKVFHSSGHGGPVFNEEKYYPPLGDEGEVEDEVVSDPAHVPAHRHVSNVRVCWEWRVIQRYPTRQSVIMMHLHSLISKNVGAS